MASSVHRYRLTLPSYKRLYEQLRERLMAGYENVPSRKVRGTARGAINAILLNCYYASLVPSSAEVRRVGSGTPDEAEVRKIFQDFALKIESTRPKGDAYAEIVRWARLVAVPRMQLATLAKANITDHKLGELPYEEDVDSIQHKMARRIILLEIREKNLNALAAILDTIGSIHPVAA